MIKVMNRRTNNSSNERDQLDILTTDQLLPEDHLVRKLAAAFVLMLSVH
ncbi:hypothetical protein ACMGD3_08625 [Lysinibacillus sphaericus]